MIALLILLAVLIFVAVLLVRATRVKPTPIADPLPPTDARGGDDSIERFQEMLRSATVWAGGMGDLTPFDEFVPKLKRLYPTVFANLELTMVNTYGIMLTWKGTNPGRSPIVLTAHHDVVEANAEGWTHDPFGADIADGKIWARGVVDTKCILAALLEATSTLLDEGYVPPRDVIIFSSNCEEDNGNTTPKMIELLKERGVVPFLVLDEGGAVIDNPPLGVTCDFAVIGVAEKGLFNAHVTTTSKGGHASTPSLQDATGKLVSGLDALQKTPGPARLSSPIEAMLKELAAHAGFGLKIVFGNLWLFRPLVLKIMKGNHETAAMVRTTYALTELEGSKAANVIPRQAKATVNVRIDPSETVEIAMDRLTGHFDAETNYRLDSAINPSPLSPFDDEVFDYLRKVIHSVYPDAGIAPYVQSSCSDARHFSLVCPHVYRFAGILFKGDQRASIHGQDENLDVESFKRGVGFYTELIRHFDMLEK